MSEQIERIDLARQFRDVPLSNFDFKERCEQLGVTLKRIFSRIQPIPLKHSPFTINLDDFGFVWSHWVCYSLAKKDESEYFDSFGLTFQLSGKWMLKTTASTSSCGIHHKFRR